MDFVFTTLLLPLDEQLSFAPSCLEMQSSLFISTPALSKASTASKVIIIRCGIYWLILIATAWEWIMNRASIVPSNPHVRDIQHSLATQFRLSQRQYVALWMMTVLLHSLCAVFLLSSAKLYWIMESESAIYFASLLAPESDRHFRTVGTCLGIIGVAHALQLLSHVTVSIIARRPTVRQVSLGVDAITLVVQRIERLQRWFTARGDSEMYGRMFAVRKMVEIATQVPQSYLYSTLIARPWINHIKVAVVITNCWSAFGIHRMLIRSEGAREMISPTKSTKLPSPLQTVRFSAVVVDALLATTTSVVIPTAIFAPYLLQLDFENFDFPDSLLYGEKEFINLVHENRAFFAISWTNAAIKGVPHVSAFLCLLAIASMLESSQSNLAVFSEATTSTSLVRPPDRKQSRIKSASYHTLTLISNSVQSSTQFIRRVHRLVAPMVFLGTGAAVLIIHIIAQIDSFGDASTLRRLCLQPMHPWFALNFSCSVVKYNCYNDNTTSPVTVFLDSMDRGALHRIIFMHCSAFVMPSIIRKFPSLMGIELRNITLVEWGLEAALMADLHPELLFVFFTYVNLTAIPPGILQSPVPHHLTDIEFSHTNLTTVPKQIADVWSQVQILYIEHSQLNIFSAELLQLPQLNELSLIDNKVETMPDDVFLTMTLTYLYDLALSRNPLQTLPNATHDDFSVYNLALEFTLVSALPAWTNNRVLNSISLAGSPLCRDSFETKLHRIERCGEDGDGWDPIGDERYPTRLMQLHRSLNG